jgi:hypothetical protein
MKYTKNEILKALTIIKEVCEEVEDCINCPYGDCMGVCQILQNDTPNSWAIKEAEEVWRAFE